VAYEAIRYEVEGPVARLTIDREARRNALSDRVVAELRAALAAAREDRAVRVVVLTGAGERAFCAGADLEGMGGTEGGALAAHRARGEVAALFEDLWSLGKPTIARVRGYALAGGFGLALACDFVVAADDAQFGTPEIDVGLWPFMITVPLVRSMAPKRALELMLTGRRWGATRPSASAS
jgi:enoyl-CoA hydratase/carnithine racemase